MKNKLPSNLKIMICAAFLLLAWSAAAIRAQTAPAAAAADTAAKTPAAAVLKTDQPPYTRSPGKQRFRRYLDNTVGPFALAGVAVFSAFDQADNTPPEWRKTAAGYGRRFASNLGESAIQETVAYGLEEVLKLDSKFYRSQKRDFGSRLKNGLLASVTGRTPAGKRVFNPSRIAGAYAGSLIATQTWYPARFGYQDGLRRGTLTVAANIGFGLVEEFIFRRKK